MAVASSPQSCRLAALAALCFALAFAQFAQAAEAPEYGWAAEGELGYVDTSGNTETGSLISSLKIANKRPKWDVELALGAYFSESSGATTSERYVASLQGNYHLSDRGYVFARGEYEDDRFAGYDYRVKEAAGYGYELLRAERVRLKVEAGPGGRHSRTTTGDRDDEGMLYASAGFLWKLSPGASFEQTLRAEVGQEGTVSESVSAIKATIVGGLAMKVSYTLRDNTDPPPGARSTDTLLAATLVFSL